MGLSLLTAQKVQHIARLGNVRKIDLGSDFIAVAAAGALRPGRARRVTRPAEVSPHLVGFVILERTRMGLLLGDAHLSQHIENSFAFNFQLPGQIVDSNLAHPPFCSSGFSR
jgi:hypothetical protein